MHVEPANWCPDVDLSIHGNGCWTTTQVVQQLGEVQTAGALGMAKAGEGEGETKEAM